MILPHHGLTLLVPAFLLLVACQNQSPPLSSSPRTVTGVSLETLAPAAILERSEAVGTVRAKTIAILSARLAGTVSTIRVSAGDHVRAGQLLATIDAAEINAGAASADAAVEEAKRAVEEATSRKELATVTHERFKRLFDAQAATRQELDTKVAEKEIADKGVARAEARLTQAR